MGAENHITTTVESGIISEEYEWSVWIDVDGERNNTGFKVLASTETEARNKAEINAKRFLNIVSDIQTEGNYTLEVKRIIV